MERWLLLLLLVLFWGSAFAAIELALASFAPLQVVAGRLLIGALMMLATTLLASRRWPRSRRVWGEFLAMAVVGNALPFTLIAWGQLRVDSASAGILMAVMPLTVLVLAHLFADEALNGRRIIGFVLGFAGVVVLLDPGALLAMADGAQLTAKLAILTAAICYGANVILARRRSFHDPAVTAAAVLTLSACFVLPLSLREPLAADALRPGAPLVAVLALGALSTGAATLVYFRLVSIAEAAFVSLINYLIPMWAVLLGGLALGEAITPQSLGAMALILTGVAVSQLGQRRRPAGATPRTR